MSGITLTEVANSTIPTPASGKATLFQSTDEEAPAYKDDAGVVHSLKGDDGDPAPALVYQDHSNTGATETVDASNADVHRLLLDAATVTLTLTGWAASGTPHVIRLWLEQDGTGGRDIAWPAAVTWGEPGEPDWTTRGAGDIDIVDLMTVDGGTTVFAGLFGREGPAGANTAAADVTADTTGYGNSSASDVQAVLDDFDSAITAAAGGTAPSCYQTFLTGDVTATNANTAYDVLSLSLPAGDWLVTFDVTTSSANANPTHQVAQIYDGTSVVADASGYHGGGAGGGTHFSLSARITLGGTTTIKGRIMSLRGSSDTKALATALFNGTTNKATSLKAVKVTAI